MSAGEIALVLVWAGIAAADETAAFQTMLHQPLVSCTVIGALLGEPAAGLAVALPLQAVWSGLLPLGAASYPDVPVGSVVAVLAAVLAGRAGGSGVGASALVFGLACGLLAGAAGSGSTRALRRACARLSRAADRVADRGDAAGIVLLNAVGAGASFARGAAVTAIALALSAALSGAAGRIAPGASVRGAPLEPVLGVGMGVLAATFAAGGRRRYAVFLCSAAAAFLLDWKIL